MQNGKDIGYSYVVEEPEKQAGHDGVSVGIRTRTITTPPAPAPAKKDAAPATRPAKVQRDSETLMWMSFDRKHETWSTVVFTDDGKLKDTSTEFGASDRQTNRVFDKELPVGEKEDPRNPAMRPADTYTLNVTALAGAATAASRSSASSRRSTCRWPWASCSRGSCRSTSPRRTCSPRTPATAARS